MRNLNANFKKEQEKELNEYLNDNEIANQSIRNGFLKMLNNGTNLANIKTKEMLKTFNCGIGMTITCSPTSHDNVFYQLEKLGEKPIVIGRVTNSGTVNYSGNFT